MRAAELPENIGSVSVHVVNVPLASAPKIKRFFNSVTVTFPLKVPFHQLPSRIIPVGEVSLPLFVRKISLIYWISLLRFGLILNDVWFAA
jgi:hypothetical protein